MGDFFKSIKFKILLGIAALLIGVMIYSATQSGSATGGSSLIGTVFKPIQTLSNKISSKVENKLDILMNAQDYYDENQALKQQITDLYQQMADYENIKSEINELRKFVGIKEDNQNFELSPPCNITGRVANDPFGAFTIDKGTNDGIALYDSVVTGDGIVGVVTEVADSYATVKTLLSPDVSVGAVCVKSKETGIIQGSVTLAQDGLCKMQYLNTENSVAVGDIIVTAGNDTLYPQNYVIGTVKEIKLDQSGLTAYAIIQPVVDSTNVTSVIVITSLGNQDASSETTTPAAISSSETTTSEGE